MLVPSGAGNNEFLARQQSGARPAAGPEGRSVGGQTATNVLAGGGSAGQFKPPLDVIKQEDEIPLDVIGARPQWLSSSSPPPPPPLLLPGVTAAPARRPEPSTQSYWIGAAQMRNGHAQEWELSNEANKQLCERSSDQCNGRGHCLASGAHCSCAPGFSGATCAICK